MRGEPDPENGMKSDEKLNKKQNENIGTYELY